MSARARFDRRILGAAAFRDWFGASRAVDGKNRPLVLYHGTNQPFAEFHAAKVGGRHTDWDIGPAFYFSAFPASASAYAESRWSQRDETPASGANVMPVFLRILNPLIEDFQELAAFDWLAGAIEKAKDNGHDGLIAVDIEDGVIDTQYVVFSPAQIRSIYSFHDALELRRTRQPVFST